MAKSQKNDVLFNSNVSSIVTVPEQTCPHPDFAPEQAFRLTFRYPPRLSSPPGFHEVASAPDALESWTQMDAKWRVPAPQLARELTVFQVPRDVDHHDAPVGGEPVAPPRSGEV
jgi:hypothetical protein